MMRGKAMERILAGAHVLCRKGEVRLAPKEIANGTAGDKPAWGHPCAVHDKGHWIKVTPIEGLCERDLHALAAGPIMEPLRLYLPAGKLTEEEYQERLKLDFERAGISEGAA